MENGKKIYFASDFHLGVPSYESSLEREKKVVKWLESIRVDASEIYLVGDIFDFWFEYKTVVPRGFVRLLGKIAEITDSGIPIHFFTGNHDMWTFDYLEKECGVKVYRQPIEIEYNDKKFFIGHGDGLGPGETSYKILKAIFASKLCQWSFARLHPNLGIGIANLWSKRSRISNAGYDEIFYGEEKEILVTFCKNELKKSHFDYFIFGHRHLVLDIAVGENSRYINLGEWVTKPTYAEFDGKELKLLPFS
ncbi:MAG: UDP-2,3-diacylglucosamine diphosphatase [Flavobacteriales bacterium]|jgi:UDP-2,3-diacylglucosamine hydrolase|nr:UDP-2,3-diacylglucosamine diphosphatase [Flavobacteriales bacterium]MBT6746369.1 UDP-2,3-diacylglucosamine diphosphatase [Flavobacteriales bacterium]